MIACYSRVSTQEQAVSGFSLDEQQERMQNYCHAMGWKTYKQYTDGGFSGANTERPALQQLIRDVKAHKVERVLVYKLDRLSRSQRDTLSLIEDVFLANGCEFVSMSENFDTGTPLGRAMIGILAVFAQLEREQIKERMIMGKEARARQGKYHGSDRVPIGYDYINGELVVNPSEALQIKQAYESFVSGMSIPKIAQAFNDAGIESKYGRWHTPSLRRILPKKTYIGYIYSRGEWIKGVHEPIISEELFYKAQAIMEHTHAESIKYNRRYGKVTSYLGGLIYCGECGCRFYKKTKRAKDGKIWKYYACNTRRGGEYAKGIICKNPSRHMEEVEEEVFDEIRKLTFEEYEPVKVVDNRPDMLEKSLQDVEQKISRLIDLYADGTLSRANLEGKIKALNDKREKLTKEIESIEKEAQDHLTHKDALKYANSLDEVLERGNYDEIRAILTTLIDKIIVGKDDITIYWAFS